MPALPTNELRTVESIARMEARIAELTARATAAEARVAELLSDRAEAAEVLVTEVERAQTAERRAAELTAALHFHAPKCDRCGSIATHIDVEWKPPRYACDHCTKIGVLRAWSPLHTADVLRSLDGVSR